MNAVWRHRKIILLLLVLMVVSIVPFLILGGAFESRIKAWLQQDWSDWQLFWLLVSVLSIDIVLPIPSSAVCTFAGASLGFFVGTFAAWSGLTLGSCLGFAVARTFGPQIVHRLTRQDDLYSLRHLNETLSTWIIVLTRPLPILAEATILLLGSLRFPWSRLLLPIMTSHLVIAMAYAAMGSLAVTWDLTLYVAVASVALPLLLTHWVRGYLAKKFPSSETSTSEST